MQAKMLTRLGSMLSKNLPTILTGLGVAGVFTTAISAIEATPKAVRILEDEKKNVPHLVDVDGKIVEIDGRELTKLDILKLTWRCYIPAMIMGGVTVGCIIGANSINLKRNAALASLYSLSEVALKEYKDKVVEVIGENKAREVKDEIAKDRITKNPVKDNQIINTINGDTLCYESLSGRYFRSDIEYIRKVFNDMNERLMNERYVGLNEYYYDIGLEPTTMGDEVGWHMDEGQIVPHFSSHLTKDGRPCLSIDYDRNPRYSYGV